MSIYSDNFRVTLSDIDENNKLSNKGILRILQEIAAMHSNMVGFGLNDIESTSLFWILLNWKLQVFSRPTWNTNLKVKTWPTRHTQIGFYRDFEVLDESNNLVAIATSKWLLFDFKKGCICKISKDIEAKYHKEIDKNIFDTPLVEKLVEPIDSVYVSKYTVCKRDIDSNHHVNNLNYLDFAYEALPEIKDFKNVEIMYKRESKLGDILNLYYSKNTSDNYVVIKNSKDNKLNCIVKLY